MLTLTARFRAGLEQGTVKPTFRIHFGAIKGGGAHIATVILGPDLYDTDPPIVIDFSALSTSVDLLHGTMTTGGITVSSNGHPILREIVEANRLLGKDLIVEWGFPDVPSWVAGDFVALFAGPVQSINSADDNKVTIQATTVDSFRKMKPLRKVVGRGDAEIAPVRPASYGGGVTAHNFTFIDDTAICSSAHPLEFILDVLGQANIPARYIDSTSFDHTTVANEAIDHFKVAMFASHAADSRMNREVGVREIVEEVAFFIGGFVFVTEAGVITFKLIDPAGASVATFDGNQIFAGGWSVSHGTDELLGRVRVETCAVRIGSSDARDARVKFTLEDRTFQDNWGTSTAAVERVPYSIDLRDRYFGTMGTNLVPLSGGAFTSFIAQESYINTAINPNLSFAMFGLSGNQYGYCGHLSTGQEAAADHPVYLLIQGFQGALGSVVKRAEIVKCIATTAAGGTITTLSTLTHLHGDSILAGAGQPWVNHELECYDITVPYTQASNLLEWYGGVTEVVRFTTNMMIGADGINTYEIQVGDIVSIDDDRYLAYNQDGTPTGIKFIVRSKSIDPGNLSIGWELQRLRSGTPTLTVPAIDHINRIDSPASAIPNDRASMGRASYSQAVDVSPTYGFHHAVDTGGTHGVTVATLDATIDEVDGFWGRSRQSGEDFDITYTASKDTYVFIVYTEGTSSWSYQTEEQVLKTAPPSGVTGVTGSQFATMRVRTDGAEVTGVVDLRNQGFVAEKSCHPSQKLEDMRSAYSTNRVITKLTTANAAGLVIDLVSCACMIKGVRYERTLDEAVTLAATKANWVYLTSVGSLGNQGAFDIVAGTIGAGEPSTRFGDEDYCLVGVIETAGAAIVEVRNWVVTYSTDGLGSSANSDLPQNSSFESLDSSGAPWGWTITTTATGTSDIVSGETDVKFGRVGVRCTNAANGDKVDLVGEAFSGSPLMKYDAMIVVNAETNPGLISAGLIAYDADGAILATRAGLRGSDPLAVSGVDGNVFTATWTGVGGAATQLPSLTRFIRPYFSWVADAGEAYDQVCTISLFKIEPTL